jgi:hypothetical protein
MLCDGTSYQRWSILRWLVSSHARRYRRGNTVLPSNDLTLLIHAFTLSPSHTLQHTRLHKGGT